MAGRGLAIARKGFTVRQKRCFSAYLRPLSFNLGLYPLCWLPCCSHSSVVAAPLSDTAVFSGSVDVAPADYRREQLTLGPDPLRQ